VNHPLLTKVDEIRAGAPAARRAILDLILEDPDRVLEESFEQLAERAGSSVPTVMRTCRDLGYAGLREFKLALAQELALGGSPLHRRVNIADAADEVVPKVARSAAASVAGVRNQLDMATLADAVAAIAAAPHIDVYGAGNTSWFMAADLQARLFRAVQANDLAEAKRLNDRINPMARVFYADPAVDMHNRMKEALVLLGKLPRAVVRPPLVKIESAEIERIRLALIEAGLLGAAERRSAA
jgi:DNA-binding Lrp family transcriptional regulator